jgi:hypothetical protein
MTQAELAAWIEALRALDKIIHSNPVQDRSEAVSLQMSYDRLYADFGDELAQAVMKGDQVDPLVAGR